MTLLCNMVQHAVKNNYSGCFLFQLFGRAFIDSYRLYAGGNGQNSSDNDVNVTDDDENQFVPQGVGHFVAA